MTTPNYIKLDACMQAEDIYNRVVEWYRSDDYSDAMDKHIADTNKIYFKVLNELRTYGIGGVLINGYFRNVNESKQ